MMSAERYEDSGGWIPEEFAFKNDEQSNKDAEGFPVFGRGAHNQTSKVSRPKYRSQKKLERTNDFKP